MMPFLMALWRELASNFASRGRLLAILLFPALAASMAFYMGDFYQSNQATLAAFFAFHPWIYLLLMPALAMGTWSNKLQPASVGILMTLPITVTEMVLAKFTSTWLIAGVALLLTFPMVLTVNYLGESDNGAIAAGYLGSWLLAGVFLAVGGFTSAMLNSALSGYITAVVMCLLLLADGFTSVTQRIFAMADQGVIESMVRMSLLNFFEHMGRGILDAQELLLVFTIMVAWLAATVAAIKLKTLA